MTTYQQLVKPNTSITDQAGACHRFARRVFDVGAVAGLDSAWKAWTKAPGRHKGAHPSNVAVPIWFSHYGTYGNPPRYANWGHVIVFVPGRGYLSSPGSGKGQRWFRTIAEVERYFNAKYVGWSEGINGVRVVEPEPKPKPKVQEDDMIFIRKGPQNRVYAFSPMTGKKRGIGTIEWDAIQRAYATSGLKTPVINLTAAEAKTFKI